MGLSRSCSFDITLGNPETCGCKGGNQQYQQTRTGDESSPVVSEKNTMIWPKDGKEMVRVPAAVFLYGEDNQEVELPEFWIDKIPVTTAEYARFVADTSHKPPIHWKGETPLQEMVDHPTGIMQIGIVRPRSSKCGSYLQGREYGPT